MNIIKEFIEFYLFSKYAYLEYVCEIIICFYFIFDLIESISTIVGDLMKKTICFLLSAIFLLSAFYPCKYVISKKNQEDSISKFSYSINELIEKYDTEDEYQDDVVKDRLIVSAKNIKNDYDSIESVSGLGYTVLQYDDKEIAENAKEELESKGYTVEYDMAFNCCDVTSTNETSETWANERVESEETLNAIKASGKELSEVTVGVIDTGADYTHPLIADRIENKTINFSSSGNENDCMDDRGHGTMVAGVIAQNTTDNVKIKPYKLINKDGKCTVSQTISLLTYILNEEDAPDIINMSFGIRMNSKTPILTDLMNQIINKGIIAVAAAGNDNVTVEKFFPANVEDVISVSASDVNNKKCSFSNYGDKIDLAAPGYQVYTSTIGGDYSTVNGTSFSSPFVVAACATVLMQNPSLTSKEVENLIKSSCVGVQNTYTDVEWCSSGILNFRGLFEDDLIPTPVLSSSSGAYNCEFELTMSAPENYQIVYTTDYSIPSLTNGVEYTKPIHISENQHIIATAISEDKQSKYISATYQVVYTPEESELTISSSGNITGYTGDKSSLIIPETVNGITVKGIGLSAFKESNIIYIELPETATLIRQYAFSSSNISTIIAPGITQIDSFAFKGCSNLFNVDMPNVITVDREAFNGCKRLDSVNFNERVEELGDLSFASTNYQDAYFPNIIGASNIFDSSNLYTADFPNAKWISGTFCNCNSLKYVNIPNVTEIGEDSFNRCMNLTELDFSNIETVEYGGLSGSYFYEIELDNCTELGQSAFTGCYAKYISIPKVETIYSKAFSNCTTLISVDMPNVTTFYNSATDSYFSNCLNLKSLYLPKATFCPTINWDVKGIEAIKNGTEPELSFVYAPNAITVESSNSKVFLQYCTNLDFVFIPKATGIQQMAEIPNSTWYFSEAMEKLPDDKLTDTTGYRYTIVAPSNSYAQDWVIKYDHTFIPSEDLSFSAFDENSFIYSTSDGKQCSMPVDIVEQMWYDNLPINESSDFMTHGYIFDVVNDDFINAKDFAKIHHISKYGW